MGTYFKETVFLKICTKISLVVLVLILVVQSGSGALVEKKKSTDPKGGDHVTKYLVTLKSFYSLSLYRISLYIEFAIGNKK